jgi:hypothetical protein
MYLKLIFVGATMLATSAIAQKAIDGSDSALDPEMPRRSPRSEALRCVTRFAFRIGSNRVIRTGPRMIALCRSDAEIGLATVEHTRH